MNIGLDFRQSRVLEGVIAALERMAARINTVWKKEHKVDGTHSTITADAITVGGEVIDADHIAYTNVNNHFTAGQTIAGAVDITGPYALLFQRDTLAPVGQQFWRTLGLTDGNHYIEATLDDGFTVVMSNKFLRAGGIAERNRTVPMGEWINVPFNAANFITDTGAFWTVAAGNIVANRYTLIGKTMHWMMWFQTTTVTVASLQLQVAIPGGFTSGFATGANAVGQFIANGIAVRGIMYVASPTHVFIQAEPLAVLPAGVSNYHVIGQITLEIN